MKDWIPPIIILALLAVVLGAPFLLRAEAPAAGAGALPAGADAPRLVILTPHNEQIRFEFGRAFNQWRAEQGRPAVEFDWRSSGGTSDLRKQVLSELEKAAREGAREQGIGYDLFFGGGASVTLLNPGVLKRLGR